MAQVRAEVQGSNAKELLDNLTDKCYIKCIPKPGTSMSSAEEVSEIRPQDVESLTQIYLYRHAFQDAWICIFKPVSPLFYWLSRSHFLTASSSQHYCKDVRHTTSKGTFSSEGCQCGSLVLRLPGMH